MHGITSPVSHPAPPPAGLAALGGRLSADVQQDAAHVYQQLMGLSFTEDELSGAVLGVRVGCGIVGARSSLTEQGPSWFVPCGAELYGG